MGQRLPILDPVEDEAILHAAGFGAVELFYAGLAFRGWVARADASLDCDAGGRDAGGGDR